MKIIRRWPSIRRLFFILFMKNVAGIKVSNSFVDFLPQKCSNRKTITIEEAQQANTLLQSLGKTRNKYDECVPS